MVAVIYSHFMTFRQEYMASVIGKYHGMAMALTTSYPTRRVL
jgi:hypothetical protein